MIGSCGFNYIDFENERAEIGYDLGKDIGEMVLLTRLHLL